MAQEEVASAVVLPESEVRDSPIENSLKRRNSETKEQDSKRQRTDVDNTSPDVTEEASRASATPDPEQRTIGQSAETAATDTQPTRKKSLVGDEKQRSKRLFGALLGNLNRPNDKVSKRRTEIEQRRKAELQKQDEERLEDRQKRLENLTAQRRKEQIRVDEDNVSENLSRSETGNGNANSTDQMRIRHENMLLNAKFLQTTTEPKLYYLPWDLSSDQEDIIDDQIKITQAQIDEEVAQFAEQKKIRLRREEGSEEVPDYEDGIDEVETSNAQKSSVTKNTPDQAEELAAANGESHNATDSYDSTHKSSPEEPPDTDKESGEQTAKDQSNGASQTAAGDRTDVITKDDLSDDDDDDGHVVEGDEDTVIY